MDLEILEIGASVCTTCDLHKGRKTPVFAKGNPESKIMVCGMVPAKEENEAGIPFVGRAGKLLDKILTASNLALNDVYITNLVKCFLAAGLPLKQEWIDDCLSYLLVQIFTIQPDVIITLGKDASFTLLGLDNKTSLGSIQGKVFDYINKTKIIPTYHPSFLLRKGGENNEYYDSVVNDFKLATDIVNKYLTN